MKFIFCPLCGCSLSEDKEFCGIRMICSGKVRSCYNFEHEQKLTWESVHLVFGHLKLYITWSTANHEEQGGDIWTIWNINGDVIATGSDATTRWDLNNISKVKDEVETLALFI